MIRSIAKLFKFIELIFLITLYIDFSLDRCWNTHWTRIVYTKNNTYIFGALLFLILNLSCCFNYIIGCLSLWFFFLIKINLIFCITKFASPDLLFISISIFCFFNFTGVIKNSLAIFTNYWITSCNFSLVSKSS